MQDDLTETQGLFTKVSPSLKAQLKIRAHSLRIRERIKCEFQDSACH